MPEHDTVYSQSKPRQSHRVTTMPFRGRRMVLLKPTGKLGSCTNSNPLIIKMQIQLHAKTNTHMLINITADSITAPLYGQSLRLCL